MQIILHKLGETGEKKHKIFSLAENQALRGA